MIWKNQETKAFVVFCLILSSIIIVALTITPASGQYSYDLKTFSNYDDLKDFLETRYENNGNYQYYGWGGRGEPMILAMEDSMSKSTDGSNEAGGETVDYSETNVQVEGVDEPDIVKTDGTYLYIVANGHVYIVEAYPAEEAVVLAEITPEDGMTVTNIFINDDILVIFGNTYEDNGDDEGESVYYYGYWGESKGTVLLYDISDRENPVLDKEITIDGTYYDARMIGEYIYVIITEYSYNIYRMEGEEVILDIPELCIDDDLKQIPSDQIYYVDVPELSDTMTHVLSVNIEDGDTNQKSFMLGSSQSMYVSNNNIFLTSQHYEYISPLLDGGWGESKQTTILHKISIDAGDISYASQGEVPGGILNQFSMDEHNGFFRVATTVGTVWSGESSNNIYILDENLDRVSEIEDIAPGESIYSARFMGAKAYLVTFKKIDPFFTIDLSDPYKPEILGKLKIPGYSDYLHPYDENHIIGIGKDTVEPEEGETWGRDFAWYQGIKIALFDVSDFENPKEVAKIIIGDRGTDSPALHDHKAFLFDKEKELLVIPVRLCEISDEIKEQNPDYTGSIYGDPTFQGAYVYHLSLEAGFEFQGRITHADGEDLGDWYGSWGSSTITRTLYIGNVLYTISNKMVKMNELDDLNEINEVLLS